MQEIRDIGLEDTINRDTKVMLMTEYKRLHEGQNEMKGYKDMDSVELPELKMVSRTETRNIVEKWQIQKHQNIQDQMDELAQLNALTFDDNHDNDYLYSSEEITNFASPMDYSETQKLIAERQDQQGDLKKKYGMPGKEMGVLSRMKLFSKMKEEEEQKRKMLELKEQLRQVRIQSAIEARRADARKAMDNDLEKTYRSLSPELQLKFRDQYLKQKVKSQTANFVEGLVRVGPGRGHEL